PAAASPRDAEVEAGAKDVAPAHVRLDECDRRLRDHKRDVALEPVVQALALMRHRVLPRAQVDENRVAVDVDGKAAELVGELIERAARSQVEARVMPVAREDPVADAPAVEREA